jgi:hypothetical protein
MPTLLLCLRSGDPEVTATAIREAVGEIYPEHGDYEITGIARPGRSQHVVVEITLPEESGDSVGPGMDRSRGEPRVESETPILDVRAPEGPSR